MDLDWFGDTVQVQIRHWGYDGVVGRPVVGGATWARWQWGTCRCGGWLTGTALKAVSKKHWPSASVCSWHSNNSRTGDSVWTRRVCRPRCNWKEHTTPLRLRCLCFSSGTVKTLIHRHKFMEHSESLNPLTLTADLHLSKAALAITSCLSCFP